MRKALNLATLLTLCALVLVCSGSISAQNREKFVISAKAGGVNAVTGQATVHAKGETEWQQLSVTDDLNAGDRVRTAGDGRVEILLNPGSYLRVGGNSEVELSNNSLENLELRLIRGTAIVEAAGADGLQLNISISTPHTKLAIVRHGLYRLNVVPGDATELIVRKGSVILNDSHTKVKGGNKVVFNATTVSVAKMTKEEKENEEGVDSWSKDRGKALAKANSRINGRMINSALTAYNNNYFGFRMNRGLGLWFYNDLAGCYTFLPFFYGFGSPYGGSYSQAVYFYGGRAWTGSQVPYYQGSGIPAGTTGNSSAGSASGGYTRPPTVSNPGSATQGEGRVSMPPPARNPDSGERMIRRPERTIEPGRP